MLILKEFLEALLLECIEWGAWGGYIYFFNLKETAQEGSSALQSCIPARCSGLLPLGISSAYCAVIQLELLIFL